MSKLVQIQCAKCDNANPHQRVRYVGGMNPDGTRWKMSEDEAVTGMKEGKLRFWTSRRQKIARVSSCASCFGLNQPIKG